MALMSGVWLRVIIRGYTQSTRRWASLAWKYLLQCCAMVARLGTLEPGDDSGPVAYYWVA